MVALNINGKNYQADVDLRTPLLWVLRDTLGLTGTKGPSTNNRIDF